MNDKTHLTFGGSSAHRWLRCAGSVKICATLPPQAENEHMAAGTRAHALLELAVSERADNVSDFKGQSLRPGWPAFTEDDVNAVNIALDYINSLLAKDSAALLFVERHVTLSEDVGGTADVVVYLPSAQALHVIDYKHGRRYVEADGNPQIKLYASATVFGFTEAPVSTVYGTIIQPRTFTGEPIRTAIYGPADLIAYSDDVDAAVARARQDDAPFAPGEEQCHWCPAAHVCPALGRSAEQVADAVSACVPSHESDMIVTLPTPERMRTNIDALADMLKAIPLLQAWIDAVEDAALAAAKSGQQVPGFKLVPTRPSRSWIDGKAALDWFASSTMLDEDEYAPRKLLSVAQAEALAKTQGKAAVKALAAFVRKESSGVKLVPETAKGDAIDPSHIAAQDFGSAVTL